MTPTKEQLEALAEKHCTIHYPEHNHYLYHLDQLDTYFNERLKMVAGSPVAWASQNVIPLTGGKDNHPCTLTPFKCAANTVPLYTLEIK